MKTNKQTEKKKHTDRIFYLTAAFWSLVFDRSKQLMTSDEKNKPSRN